MAEICAEMIRGCLGAAGLEVQVASFARGPQFYTATLLPEGKTTVRRLINFQADLSVRLGRDVSISYEAGSLFMQIDTNEPLYPRLDDFPRVPYLRLGVNPSNQPVTLSPPEIPHMLVAGTTGSGKTVAMITVAKEFLRLGYQVQLFDYKNSKAYQQAGFENEAARANSELSIIWLSMVRTIKPEPTNALPLVPTAILIDEFQAMPSECLYYVKDLLARGREFNIHLVLATQHPTVKVVSSALKANCPTRLALRTATASDSRVILDQSGAEKLLGCGDALLSYGGKIQRLQVFAP
jgi:S-DNA-T family DNA segregation ATPase FtsK/SpoIIIE